MLTSCLQQPVDAEWQVGEPDAGGMKDGIADRSCAADATNLAYPLDAERVAPDVASN